MRSYPVSLAYMRTDTAVASKLLEELPCVFTDRRRRASEGRRETTSELYRQNGQLKVEMDWLKKKSQMLLLKKKER
jgi:hypothetical protein